MAVGASAPLDGRRPDASSRCRREPHGAAYDWPGIGRILVALISGRIISRRESDRSICVAHALQAILAGRPDLAEHLPAIADVVWPARLLEALTEQASVRAAHALVASLTQPLPAAVPGPSAPGSSAGGLAEPGRAAA